MSKRKETKPPTAEPSSKPAKRDGFVMHEHIGSRLRAMFDEVVEEPVPDKLRHLLEELERKRPKD